MPQDLNSLTASMTELQRRVLTDAMSTEADVMAWQETLWSQNEQITARTIGQLLSRHGSGSVPVVLSAELIETIRQAAKDSAASITRTYNLALATAILTIGAEYPDAVYEDYRNLLLGDTPFSNGPGMANWASQQGVWKMKQIAMIETAMAINLAIELFYENNPDLDGQAELLPYFASCPVCQAGIDRNPYPSASSAYNAGPWPAHVGCIHYVDLITPRMAADSGELWRG